MLVNVADDELRQGLSGKPVRPLKPFMISAGMTSSIGTILSLSGPPPRRLSFLRAKAILLVRLCTIACMFMCAMRSSFPR